MVVKYYIGSLSSYRKPFEGGFHKKFIKEACLERIQLHNILAEDDALKPWSPEWISLVKNRISNSCVHLKNLLLNPTEEDLVVDYLSFWYISLAYSRRNRECQQYFVKREMEWFQFRYMHSSEEYRLKFRTTCSKISVVDEDEKQTLREHLIDTEPNITANFQQTECFQVHWIECPLIIVNREFLLVKGTAYFFENQLIEVLCSCLAHTWKKLLKLHNKHTDSRVLMLTSELPMPKMGLRKNYNILNEITIENIDDYAIRFFPPCSLYLHFRLRNDNHLKYDSKMQLGVFLQAIGMPYTDALTYWKTEFTKKIPTDLYNRKYEYLFKHQYGMVGRKEPYRPYSCNDLIGMKVGALQLHGCPYKTFEVGKLRKLLQRVLTIKESDSVLELVVQNKYKEACTMVFNFLHHQNLDHEIEAPHEYYFKSNQCGGCSRTCSSIGMDW